MLCLPQCAVSPGPCTSVQHTTLLFPHTTITESVGSVFLQPSDTQAAHGKCNLCWPNAVEHTMNVLLSDRAHLHHYNCTKCPTSNSGISWDQVNEEDTVLCRLFCRPLNNVYTVICCSVSLRERHGFLRNRSGVQKVLSQTHHTTVPVHNIQSCFTIYCLRVWKYNSLIWMYKR